MTITIDKEHLRNLLQVLCSIILLQCGYVAEDLTLVLLCPDIYGVKDVLDQEKYHLIVIK